MRVLFTTVALPGHFFPLVPLAWACRAAGHDVLVATSEQFCSTVLGAGLPVASCGSAADFVELVRGHETERAEDQRYVNGTAFGRIAAHGMPAMMSLTRSWQPDLVVSERAEFTGPVAAAVHQIPHVELQWGVAALREYRQAAEAVLGPKLATLGLAGLPEPSLVLNTWPPSMRQTHASGHEGIRYVPYNGAADIPDWLHVPPDKPRICLTLGTVLPRLRIDWTVDATVTLLRELATDEVELLVAVDDWITAGWPVLPSAVRHVGWLPLSQVFDGCDAVIHHGGHGTTLTALRAGCPQLVLPQFDDQHDNAAAVAQAGAGITLSSTDITPRTVAMCCADLLGETRFERAAAQAAAEIAAQPSPTDMLDVLEKLAA
jgi:UDP:flavonoid glycosyltransferase YjiC (YdhE family)